MEKDILLLKSIGLSEQKAKETLKNTQVTHNIKLVIDEVTKYGEINIVNGVLIYHLATNIKVQIINHIPFLSQYMVEKKIDSVQKLDCALNYLLHNVGKLIDFQEFSNICGIGIVVTLNDIKREVEENIKKYKNEIIEKKYHFNKGILMQEIRNSLKWGDGKMIKNEIDRQLFDLLGEKLNSNCLLTKQSKSNSLKPIMKYNESEKDSSSNSELLKIKDFIKSKIHFHNPGENFKTDGYICTDNTQKLLKEHLHITGGEVRTRFPPEPNGILHIGHAKAININFGYANVHNGSCYLRYDDTNPEKEEEKFVKGILDIVKWLGYKPTKITFSSDYFNLLFTLATVLIEKGLAYICHQSSDEIKGFNPTCSPWRNRPISDNLRIFQDMKDGLLDEGEATLRMKVTLEEGKQDPVAYRIKFSSHHRTGRNWCIYPTYDFTHCLCDSIENITHSLCTKEFQSRRSSYYWLCNALDLYCPVQWEYGRLNISYTVVSKRKIAKLINERIVNNWDDPRLLTLSGLRRRGFPCEAINKFCIQMGITGAQTIVDPTVLDTVARETLNNSSPRHMVVLEPLKVTIINFPYNKPAIIKVPNFPGDINKDNHTIIFDKTVYIESSDFRPEADENFRRLTLKQTVGLKYVGIVLTVQRIEKDENGLIVNIIVHQDYISEENKPKAFIQWVSQPSLVHVRMYEKLFQHKNPEDEHQVPNGFLSDINYNSKKENFAYIDINFQNILKKFENYQFERIGFFSVDPDTKFQKVIFNRTVTLKETNYKL